jgi:hypothetical protein
MWQFCVLNFVAVFELKTLFEASLEDTNLFAGLTQRKLSEACNELVRRILCQKSRNTCVAAIMIHLISPFGSNAVTTPLLTPRRFAYAIFFWRILLFEAKKKKFRFTQVRTCSDKFRKIKQSSNPEPHLGFGPVLCRCLHLN